MKKGVVRGSGIRPYRARPYSRELGTKVTLGNFETEKEASAACEAFYRTGRAPKKTLIKMTHKKAVPAAVAKGPAESQEFTDSTGIVSCRSSRVSSAEELLEHMKVDQEKWEIDRQILETWEIGASDGNGDVLIEPLFLTKVWLKKKVTVIDQLLIEDMLAQIEVQAPKYTPLKKTHKNGSNYLLELCIPDLHLGKLAWGAETGADYDCKIAKKIYFEAALDLVSRAAQFGSIERIVFPIGNDFFQIDNSQNTTTRGTPVDVDSRWQKSFIEGEDLLVKTVEMLQCHAIVDVIVVPGNHDQQRIFYMGRLLAARFHNCPNVNVDNTPKHRKYYLYGKVLLGFTHGNEEKRSELPLIMASDEKEKWGQASYREFHVGHHHSKRMSRFFEDISEHQDVRVRTVPSLSAPDAWHVKKGYRGSRGAEAFLWDPLRGCMVQLFHNVEHGTNGI